MSIFVTGTTGYLGSYLATNLLREHKDRLALLIRAKSIQEAHHRLWKSLQLHMEFDEFIDYAHTRIDYYLGDLTSPDLGLDSSCKKKLIESMDSVIHCAASLNRKSAKVCFNVNLRGTLEILKLARAAQDHHGVRRFSDISTVAVAGHRKDEVVKEDETIDWARSDYDPYARTKKFCEHMAHELLPEVPITIFRPATILGDSRFPQTTQFDMVRTFTFFAQLPILPLPAEGRMDIVPVDYVAKAVVQIHQKSKPLYGAYNLSSGTSSPTFREIVESLYQAGFKGRHVFVPFLERPFSATVNGLMATPKNWGISRFASVVKVFFPYITYNTLFDNSRVRRELGEAPKRFPEYAYPLFRFAKDHHYNYPYKSWPENAAVTKVA